MKILIVLWMLLPAAGTCQTLAPDTPPRSRSASPPEQPVKFGFDDLMTLLIQPRHVKLFHAGTHKNWELAAAEMRDLRASFSLMANAYPKYLDNDVPGALTSMMTPALLELDDAIAAADPRRFAASYARLTAACNACHVYMEHPYIVIIVPRAPARSSYDDQDFRPAR